MGRCECSITAGLPVGGGRPECGPVGPGAPASITGRIGGCVDRTERFSGTTGGLRATILENHPDGWGGPVNPCNSIGDVSC